MLWNAAKAWERAMAPSSIERSSRGLSYWAYSLESKKRGRGQDEGGSWEKEACGREEEEEVDGVSLKTLRWDTSRECCPPIEGTEGS